jgi:F-type H+-transporting ATPase subunit a
MEHEFLWVSMIPGIKNLPPHVVHVGIIVIILTGFATIVKSRIKRVKDNVVPEEKVNLKNIFELIYEGLLSLLNSVMGHNGYKFLPLIGGTFIFIFFSNLLGIIPGFLPPTSNVNTNVACASVIFLATHYYGVKEHGFKYIKQFTGPFWWLSIIFLPIELVSHLARPFSLTLRLYGNMMGDHTVLSIFSHLVPLGVPIIFLILAVFISFIQAFIFSMLSMLYIGGAISHEH